MFLTLLSVNFLAAQRNVTTTPPVNFPDSVRIVLENTRNVDASVIGGGFYTAWNTLLLDQQQTIQQQTRLMKRKGYKVRPHLVNYFGAIVNAVSIEHADASKFSGYLSVVQKVIENEDITKALNFFNVSRTFFQYHALHYEKSFRLHVKDDDYSFEYIAPPPQASWSDTTQNEKPKEDESYNDEPASLDDQPVDTTAQEILPAWMTPPAPPYIDGAVIRFSKASLNLVTKYDSVFIKNTKGTYSFRTNLFVGENGSFDWTPAGLSADTAYCNFTNYNFNVTRPDLKADLVKLTYIGRTPGFIPGNFEFKSQTRKDSVLSTFPRFSSYQANIDVLGIGSGNVKYHGGFSLIGKKITSACALGDPSSIEVSDAGNKKFTARSQEFQFTDSTIVSNKAMVSIYQGNDSISNPVVRMKFTFRPDSAQRLLLMKDKGSMRNSPYAATYFSVDFAADKIDWSIKKDSMNIFTDGNRNTVPVIIQSVDFYDAEDFRLLKGEGFSFHPLALVVGYCLKKRVREFFPGDLAQYSGKDQQEINKAIEFLWQKGMIDFNPKTTLVKVKKKAIAFVRSSKAEGDYDNLKIHSVTDSAANVTLNVSKGYMTVRGVDEFKVSDSLNVRIKPDSSIITILQNRDLKFDGTINAGNFEISGKDFTLKYDSFFISLNHIDSINFYVMEKNSKGQMIRRKVNNSMVGADSTAAQAGGLGDISKSSGTLFISKANNKSGRKKIPNYPRLDAATGGVIYFDREEVLAGAYDKSMFFVVPPFKLDSLNDADPTSINFEGTFVSSGMFPNFKEKLHTMPDKSLGFEHKIPKGGYNLFKSEAKMTGDLILNNRGLRGAGRIDYMSASLSSPDFLFYPDSVLAKGSRGRISQKQFGPVLFPQATLPDYEMKWYPKKDEMKLKTIKAPFNFYDSTAQFNGTLTVSKNGVGGSGKLETHGTELVSRQMSFNGKDFGARHGRFKVKTDDPEKPLLTGTDIRMKFNLEQNYTDISPEVAGVAAIAFPYAAFKTSISKMRWDLNTQKIHMSKNPDEPLENSYFYTTRKDLDSLRFNAERAEYDLKTQELKVSGIPFIIVADAKITPQNNEVLILENAKIGTLKNTTIVLDTLNGYHHLTEGVVDIISRKEFSGYATYQYVNLLNDTFAIKMTDFHLEPIVKGESSKKHPNENENESIATQQTVATGSVAEQEHLVLGAGMFYKGDLIMYATKPALKLSGYVKLDIKKIKNYNTWIRYEQSGDETEVLINFNNATTEEGKVVNAGLHFTALENELYVTFLNDKKSDEDEDFFEPSGTLYYDKTSKEYKIEDREKAAGTKLSGKVFAYNDETSQVRFEGGIKLFNGSKDFKVVATTLGSGNLETNEIRMNSFVMIETNAPVTAFDMMAKNIQDVIKNEGANEGLGDQTELLYKIADIVGERVAKDYEQRSQKGYVSLGTLEATAKPLVFSNVNLKYSAKHRAFYSEGSLGISNIGRNDINGAFEGYMESKRNEDGLPVFHVFIKVSPESWYYFGFEDNRLMIHSSNNDFNTVIGKKTNAGKAKIGEVAFIPGSDDETLVFINRFRSDYYGIQVPYSLSDVSTSAVEKDSAPSLGGNIPQQKKDDNKDNKDNKDTKEKKDEEKKKDDDGF
jgi:hypothetical protein